VRIGRVRSVAIVPRGSGTQAVLHSVRLEAFRPNREEFAGFCANLLIDGGRFTHRLPLALDEVPGPWRIVATDVIPRKSATVSVKVNR